MGILSAIFGSKREHRSPQPQLAKPTVATIPTIPTLPPKTNAQNGGTRNSVSKNNDEYIPNKTTKPTTKLENSDTSKLELELKLTSSVLETRIEQLSPNIDQNKVSTNNKPNHDLAFNTERLVAEAKENPFNAVDITKDIAVETLKIISSEFAKLFQVLPFSTDNAHKTIDLYYADEDKRIEAANLLKQQYQSKVSFTYLDPALLLPYIDEQYSGLNSDFLKEQKVAQLKDTFQHINNHTSNAEKPSLTFGVEKVFDKFNATERDTANRRLNFLGTLICDAHHRRATDINICLDRKPQVSGYCKTELLVKARIDGDMLEVYRNEMAIEDYNKLTRTLRIACGLDGADETSNITGLLRPRIRYGTKESLVDLRVNFMHASDEQGNSISIRMQDKFNFQLNLDKLGLFNFQHKLFIENIICARNGLVAFAAPINKGKNVTLVSTLLEMKNIYPGKQILSLENPIEFILEGINQIEIAADKQYGDYLKDVLRHNPDVTVFSETRTEIDAKACIEAAIQGQLTLTTIHADNATQVVGRLHDLGINHYKIANALRVVVSQRLIRKICDKCEKISDNNIPTIPHLDQYIAKINWKQAVQFISATGKLANGKLCPNCQGSGYRGRVGVFEVLRLSTTLKELINRQAANQEILRHAINQDGFQTIWSNGLRRVLMGETTLAELIDKLGYPDLEMEGLDLNTEIEAGEEEIYQLAN